MSQEQALPVLLLALDSSFPTSATLLARETVLPLSTPIEAGMFLSVQLLLELIHKHLRDAVFKFYGNSFYLTPLLSTFQIMSMHAHLAQAFSLFEVPGKTNIVFICFPSVSWLHKVYLGLGSISVICKELETTKVFFFFFFTWLKYI